MKGGDLKTVLLGVEERFSAFEALIA